MRGWASPGHCRRSGLHKQGPTVDQPLAVLMESRSLLGRAPVPDGCRLEGAPRFGAIHLPGTSCVFVHSSSFVHASLLFLPCAFLSFPRSRLAACASSADDPNGASSAASHVACVRSRVALVILLILRLSHVSDGESVHTFGQKSDSLHGRPAIMARRVTLPVINPLLTCCISRDVSLD